MRTMRTTGVAGLLLAVLAGVDDCEWEGPACLRYDEVQQVFLHNAYGAENAITEEGLLDLIATHRIRGFELDLFPSELCGDPSGPADADWYVYHICGSQDLYSTVETLRDALELVAAWDRRQPDHEVVTIDLELGSNFTSKGWVSEFRFHSPEALDAQIRETLGDSLFTPDELLRRTGQSSLTDAVNPATGGGWPTVDELRGRVIVLVHGEGDDIAKYFDVPGTVGRHVRAAFQIEEGLWRDPDALHKEPDLVFHGEIDEGTDGIALRTGFPGHVFRSALIDEWDDCVRDCPDFGDVRRRRAAKAQHDGMQLLFMNAGSQTDPAYRLVNDFRYPFGASFLRSDGTFPSGADAWNLLQTVARVEPGNYLSVEDTTGGDLDGTSDRFTFAVDATGVGQSETWTALVSGDGTGRVHPHAKGMLMARSSLAPDAAYCAVGKTADLYGPRMQWRGDDGAGTGFKETYGEYLLGDADDHRDRQNEQFVKLEIKQEGAAFRCTGSSSTTGRDDDWTEIASELVWVDALPFVGFAASGNTALLGTTPTSMLFVEPTRVRDGVPTPIDLGAVTEVWVGGAAGEVWRSNLPDASTCDPEPKE